MAWQLFFTWKSPGTDIAFLVLGHLKGSSVSRWSFHFYMKCDLTLLALGHLKGDGATTCFTTSRRRSSASVLTTAIWPSCRSTSTTTPRTQRTWLPAPPEDTRLEILSLNVATFCANSFDRWIMSECWGKFANCLSNYDSIPRKGGRGCLMYLSSCLESQGCHLNPLSYLHSCLFWLVLLFLSCNFSANGPFTWLFSRKLSNIFH